MRSMSELPHAGPSLSSREDGSNGFELRTYKPEEAARIYQELEVPNWAPWLRASPETLAKRAVVLPEGEIDNWKGKRVIASISLNRFNYDGNPDNLPTWDELAGYPSTYEETYDPNGNAVAMMSINIHPEFQGQGLTGDIITAVKTLRETLGIKHIMGSFRPSQFEEYRRTYFPEKWRKMRPDVWRCGQTGIWVVGRNGATYLEGNVWGILEDK